MMTLLIFLGIFFFICAVCYLVKIILQFIGWTCQFLFEVSTHAYESTAISNSTIVQEQIRKEKLLKDQKNAEYIKKQQEADEKAYKDEVNAIMYMTSKLKAKYPLADKELFDDYMLNFSGRTMIKNKELEEKIKNQHNERMLNSAPVTNMYSINQILGLKVVDTNLDLPVSVKTFINPDAENRPDYIVLMYNQNTNEYAWYVTKEMMIAKLISTKIMSSFNEFNKDTFNQDNFNQLVDYALLDYKYNK